MKSAFLAAACLLVMGCGSSMVSHQSSTAAPGNPGDEYLIPVRPGYISGNPWWNTYAPRFLYAPAFDFAKVSGSVKYRYTVSSADGEWSFISAEPNLSLAPIWNDITPGKVSLKVEGLDGKGEVRGVAGKRDFIRDVPFKGGYPGPARGYRESAIGAARYVHGMKGIQSWLTSPEPDLSMRLNTYPCKTFGATVSLECLLAGLCPELREEAEAVAKGAAGWLIAHAQANGTPLDGFPPTYYGDKLASARAENKGKTMGMEAAPVAEAYLDLYDLCGEKRFLEEALRIADTYVRIQSPDGSWPIKMDLATGEPVNGVKALSAPVLRLFARLEDDYGKSGYRQSRVRGESYMDNVAVPSFDMTGQFEDVTVLGLKPYQNLTECTAAPYASYILTRKSPSKSAMSAALDLIRFSEDQFAHWDEYPGSNVNCCPPCVFEQFRYQTPVDHSAAVYAQALLDWWELTGDARFFEKAKALIDNLTRVQNPDTLMLPSTWDEWPSKRPNRDVWINCCLASVRILLRMDQIVNKSKI